MKKKKKRDGDDHDDERRGRRRKNLRRQRPRPRPARRTRGHASSSCLCARHPGENRKESEKRKKKRKKRWKKKRNKGFASRSTFDPGNSRTKLCDQVALLILCYPPAHVLSSILLPPFSFFFLFFLFSFPLPIRSIPSMRNSMAEHAWQTPHRASRPTLGTTLPAQPCTRGSNCRLTAAAARKAARRCSCSRIVKFRRTRYIYGPLFGSCVARNRGVRRPSSSGAGAAWSGGARVAGGAAWRRGCAVACHARGTCMRCAGMCGG